MIDSKLRTSERARMIRDPGAVLVLTTRGAPAARVRRFERAGAAVLPVRARGSRVDLPSAWRALAGAGVNEVLVEGGGTLGAGLLRAGLVDRLELFLAPVLIGGDGAAVLDSLGIRKLAGAPRLEWLATRRVGSDLHLTARCSQW